MLASGPGRPESDLTAGSRSMEQDRRDGMHSAGEQSDETNTMNDKRNSKGASDVTKPQRLPFGAGILPEDPSPASNTSKTSPEPEPSAPAHPPRPEEPVLETPTSSRAPAPEPSAPAAPVAESPPEAEAESDNNARESDEEDEASETDDDIPRYTIVDPPDEPEEDDFDRVPPGPMTEVRFEEDRPSRRRFARPRRRGDPRRRRAPRPAPAQARKTGRVAKPVLIAVLIVLAVLAAIVAIVIIGRG